MVGLHLHAADGAAGAQQRGQAALQEHRARRAGQHLCGEVGVCSSPPRVGSVPTTQRQRKTIVCFCFLTCRMYRQASNSVGLNYPPNVITELKVIKGYFVVQFDFSFCLFFYERFCLYLFQHLDSWSFNVFALNEASGDHALKFVFYELLTRYDLIHRFKVRATPPLRAGCLLLPVFQ